MDRTKFLDKANVAAKHILICGFFFCLGAEVGDCGRRSRYMGSQASRNYEHLQKGEYDIARSYVKDGVWQQLLSDRQLCGEVERAQITRVSAFPVLEYGTVELRVVRNGKTYKEDLSTTGGAIFNSRAGTEQLSK